MRVFFQIFFIIILVAVQYTQAQGLKFISSKEQPIDKRTSYNVFESGRVEFNGSFAVDFDMALYQATRIGYIIRIKNERSDRIYNLFYDGQGDSYLFRFNEEGKNSLITTRINKEELQNLGWFKVGIYFDLKGDSIRLKINNQTYTAKKAGLPLDYYPQIVFGKSDYIIDVPSFAIRNLIIGNKENQYNFPLSECEGELVYDNQGRNVGKVVNPEWLINDSYRWKFRLLAKSRSVAGANYFPQRKEIYYFNKDSILIYNVRTGEKRSVKYAGDCPVNLTLGTNFIDPAHQKLFAYELYYESAQGPTIGSLDLNTFSWTVESDKQLSSPLHHHGGYFQEETGKYMIFGGFGRMHYSNILYGFNRETRSWDTIPLTGDSLIFPRYFSCLGYQKQNNSLYIFGGMGNKSGEQVVGRKYFFDLYRVDLKSRQVYKLWEIPWKDENIVPVRGMVLQDSCFYTLCYPEHFSDSYLRLYRFSLKDGSFEILGDSIPIHSDRITTNANLYFDNQQNTLFAIIQEFDDDVASDLKVYSLSFPPITARELAANMPVRNSLSRRIFLIAVLVVLAVAGYKGYRYRNKRREVVSGLLQEDSGGIRKQHKSDIQNAIYLFGEFTVRSRQNRDISYMFSAQLKQIFLIILQYSREGISSQHLSHILWPDKPEDKVKNSRGVAINNLRKIMKELDGIELVYEKGTFKIVLAPECYCDYHRCLQIVSGNLTDETRMELLGLLERGKFLQSYDQSLFDLFKGTLEEELEPVLQMEMKKVYLENDFPAALRIAEVLLRIDPVSDEGLACQIRCLLKMKQSYEAQKRYMEFINEYKKGMGKDYPVSYNDLKI